MYPHAPGIEIGRPADTYRRIRIESIFGKLTVLVTDGHLPYPYGREITGYEVPNLDQTLAKAKAAGVAILAGPYTAGNRNAAMVQFPGGYAAEIHSDSSPEVGLLLQRRDSRQFDSSQKLQRRAAASGDVRDLIATPADLTAFSESPPPTTLTAPDAATAFATATVPISNGGFRTHPWVRSR